MPSTATCASPRSAIYRRREPERTLLYRTVQTHLATWLALQDAFITEAVVIREILGHLGEPTSPPRLMPARGPPLWEMPGSDPKEGDPRAQPAPDYEFDQRWQNTIRTDSLVGGDSCQWPPERQTYATQVTTGADNGISGAGFQGRPGTFGHEFHD